MALDQLVLGFLVLAPAHGYGLCARLNEQLCELRPVQRTHVYAALARLERRGLVVARSVRARRRARRVFRVTPAGIAAHRAWCAARDDLGSPLRRSLLVKATLVELLGERPGVLRAERVARARLAAELHDLPPAAALACLLRDRARRHLEVELWLIDQLVRQS